MAIKGDEVTAELERKITERMSQAWWGGVDQNDAEFFKEVNSTIKNQLRECRMIAYNAGQADMRKAITNQIAGFLKEHLRNSPGVNPDLLIAQVLRDLGSKATVPTLVTPTEYYLDPGDGRRPPRVKEVELTQQEKVTKFNDKFQEDKLKEATPTGVIDPFVDPVQYPDAKVDGQ